jgi:8-oxo-dGTP pyrophosphatase MutT (NUDIX family)
MSTSSPILVASAVVLHGNSILLVRRQTNVHPAWSRTWCTPGGRVEPRETPAEAAERELLEETGLERAAHMDPPELLFEYEYHEPAHVQIAHFDLTGAHLTQRRISFQLTECIGACWWTREEAQMLALNTGMIELIHHLRRIGRFGQ